MRVLVLGAGPVGLCTVAAARYLGAEVDIEAHRPTRLAAAERLGASVASAADYDVVLDAAGTQSSLDRAIELVHPGGTVGVLGTFWDPVALGMAFQMKEVTLVPAFTYGHHHGVGRVRRGRPGSWPALPDLADTLVTHRFGLDDAAEAFRVAATATRTRSRSSSTPDGRSERVAPASPVAARGCRPDVTDGPSGSRDCPRSVGTMRAGGAHGHPPASRIGGGRRCGARRRSAVGGGTVGHPARTGRRRRRRQGGRAPGSALLEALVGARRRAEPASDDP